MRITRLGLYCCHLLVLAVKASPFLALENLFQARKVGSLMFYDSVRFIQILNKTCRGPKGPYSQLDLIFCEGVRLIVFRVAVQRDRIHKVTKM